MNPKTLWKLHVAGFLYADCVAYDHHGATNMLENAMNVKINELHQARLTCCENDTKDGVGVVNLYTG